MIAVRERSKSLESINTSMGAGSNYSWIEFNPTAMEGKFVTFPERTQIPENIKEQLIVELYSK